MIKTELQQKLKDLRISLGYDSQSAFAEKLECSQGAIANIESGKRDVSKAMLLKIKEAFNIDLISWRDSKVEEKTQQNLLSVAVPFYTAKASAGNGEALPEYEDKDILLFDKRWLSNVLGINPDNAVLLQATGNSMQPLINDKDLLMVDTSYTNIINGKVFVVDIDNELLVKRVVKELDGSVILYSENPEYSPRTLKENETAKVIGKVVWNGSKEFV